MSPLTLGPRLGVTFSPSSRARAPRSTRGPGGVSNSSRAGSLLPPGPVDTMTRSSLGDKMAVRDVSVSGGTV